MAVFRIIKLKLTLCFEALQGGIAPFSYMHDFAQNQRAALRILLGALPAEHKVEISLSKVKRVYGRVGFGGRPISHHFYGTFEGRIPTL
jgi:hypothetical protein